MKIKSLSIEIREKIFWTTTFVFALSIGFYVFAVLSTVHQTVAKEGLVKSNAEMASRVSELEFKGIALKNKINFELALAHGMSEVKDALYVSRTSNSLTLNTQTR